MSTETLIKKYEIYISNVEWHINTNKPTGEGLRLSEQRLNDFKEILANLRSLESLPADTAEGLSAEEIENEANESAIDAWGKSYQNKDMDLFCDTYIEGYKAAFSRYASQSQSVGSEGMGMDADKVMKFLENEKGPLGMSDHKTIDRIIWYFKTYFIK